MKRFLHQTSIRRLTLTTKLAALAALAALFGVSAASAAAEQAGKTPLTIYVAEHGVGVGSGTFTLQGASAADSDSGRLTFVKSFNGRYGKTSEGLLFQSARRTETLKGKHGTLVIRSSGRAFPVVKNDNYVWTGTWSIASGTGKYAGLKGGGGVVGILLPSTHAEEQVVSLRYEGFVTRS